MAGETEFNKINVDINTLVLGGQIASTSMDPSGKYMDIELINECKNWEDGAYFQGHNSFFIRIYVNKFDDATLSNLKKGRQVTVAAELIARAFLGKDGKANSIPNIKVNSISVTDSPQSGKNTTDAAPQANSQDFQKRSAQTGNRFEEKVPF